MKTDEALMKDYVQTGSEALYAEIYRRNAGRAKRYVRTCLRGPYAHLVDDIVQEVFARVFTRRHQWDTEARFLPWFYAICTRVTINCVHRESRFTSEPLSNDGPEQESDDEIAVNREEVRNLLDALDPEDREMLEACYLKNLPIAEAARQADVNYNTYYLRLRVLIERIRLRTSA